MLSEEQQKNNPLHGLKLDVLLNELVDHYGWDILFAATSINSFKNNPSITSSLKFLRKTQWAQEKLESFYLYQFKRMPKPTDSQYELPPRQRLIPAGLDPKPPMEFTVEELNLKKQRKAENDRDNPRKNVKSRDSNKRRSYQSNRSHSQNDRVERREEKPATNAPVDPWANFNKDND